MNDRGMSFFCDVCRKHYLTDNTWLRVDASNTVVATFCSERCLKAYDLRKKADAGDRGAAWEMAILDDEDDEMTRNAYADYLEENDRPEEADRQREWCAAKRWVKAFAERGSRSYEDVMAAAAYYRATGEETAVDMDESNAMSDLWKEWPEFWKRYCVLTGYPYDPEMDADPYYCSC